MPTLQTMHEFSIVEALIEQVQREVERSGHDGQVQCLDLRVGRLSGVNCDALRFAFELLSPHTIMEGAQVHIAEPKAVACCHDCGAEVEIDEWQIECPECHGPNITIEGGRELLLESIELED